MEQNFDMQEDLGNPSLLGIITSPVEQFKKMRGENKIFVPMLLVVLLSTVLAVAMAYLLKPVVIEGTGPQSATGTAIFTAIGGLIGTPIAFFVMAGVYKVLAMLFGSEITYKQLLTINVFITVVTILGGLVNTLLGAAMGGHLGDSYTSLSTLFPKNSIGYHMGGIVEVFTIWHYVLLAIGLQIVGGFSKNKAIGFVAVLVVFSLLVAYGQFALADALKGFIPAK